MRLATARVAIRNYKFKNGRYEQTLSSARPRLDLAQQGDAIRDGNE